MSDEFPKLQRGDMFGKPVYLLSNGQYVAASSIKRAKALEKRAAKGETIEGPTARKKLRGLLAGFGFKRVGGFGSPEAAA